MGLGMIGAIGGIGAGLVNEGKFMERQEEADAEVARKKDYQGWLLQQQEQYQIRSEGRADQRDEQRKDRDFTRTQDEAPTRRQIAVEDDQAKARGKSKVAVETLDDDVKVKSALTEAGQTAADKNLKNAHASVYNEAAGGSGGSGGGSKRKYMAPEDEAELKGVQQRAGKLQETIDKAMAEPGGWDPEKNPGQKQLQSQMAALNLRERTILQRYRSSDTGGASDPLGVRKPSGGGMLKGGPTEAGMRDQVTGDMGADPEAIRREIAKTQADLAKVPDANSKQMLQEHLADLNRQLARAGAPSNVAPTQRPVPTAAPAPAPAAAPAPRPAAPAAAPAAVAAPAQPSLAQALGVSGRGSTLDQVIQAKIPQLDSAVGEIKQAKEQMAAVARSGDTRAALAYAKRLQDAKNRFNDLIKDMNPQQAEQVRQAAGFYM